MATKAQALYKFFSGFGIPAYAATAVPSDVSYPFLTYELALGSWGDGDTNMTVNLWYRTEGEAAPNAKAEEISAALGIGGRMVACEGGGIWLKRGTPFCQAIDASAKDELVKRRYINIDAEFLTA